MRSASVKPYSISFGSTFRFPGIIPVTSVVGFVVMALTGLPTVGAVLILPWLSATLFLHPGWLLAAYLHIPFYKSAIEDSIPVDATVWLAILCMITLSYQVYKSGAVPITSVTMLWWLLGVVMTLATSWSIDSVHSLKVLVNFLALTFLPLFLAFVVADNRYLLAQFLRSTLYGAVILSAAGAMSILVSDSGRLALTSNTIGSGRIAMIALLIAPVVVRDSRRKPFIVILIMLLSLFAVLASGSRGPLLAGAISLVVVYGVWSRWFMFRLLGMFVGLLLSWVALLSDWIEAAVPPAAIGRIRSLMDAALHDGELDASSGARVDLVAEAWNMWEMRPFRGWGPGSFEILTSTNHDYPHNSVLQAVAELGLLGLIVYVALVLLAVVKVYPFFDDRLVRGIGALMVFAVVSAQVSNGLYDNRWMWGMILLAGASCVSSKCVSDRDSTMLTKSHSP